MCQQPHRGTFITLKTALLSTRTRLRERASISCTKGDAIIKALFQRQRETKRKHQDEITQKTTKKYNLRTEMRKRQLQPPHNSLRAVSSRHHARTLHARVHGQVRENSNAARQRIVIQHRTACELIASSAFPLPLNFRKLHYLRKLIAGQRATKEQPAMLTKKARAFA